MLLSGLDADAVLERRMQAEKYLNFEVAPALSHTHNAA